MITFSPVKGQIPPFARVAAITLPASQVVSVEQVYKQILLPFKLITVEILGKLISIVYRKLHWVHKINDTYMKVEFKSIHQICVRWKSLQQKWRKSNWYHLAQLISSDSSPSLQHLGFVIYFIFIPGLVGP